MKQMQRKQEEERRLAELAQIRMSNFQERKQIEAQLGDPRGIRPSPPAPMPAPQPPSAAPPQQQQQSDAVGSPSRPVTPGDIGVDLEMTPQQREANAEQGARDFRVMLGELQDVLQSDGAHDSLDSDGERAADSDDSDDSGAQPSGGGADAQTAAAGKFKLLGATLKLPNVSDRDSVAHRIESLRMFLEKMVGDELFIKVYRLLDSMGQEDDEDAVMSKATSMLGPKKIYLSLVNQLIYCEDVFYDRVR